VYEDQCAAFRASVFQISLTEEISYSLHEQPFLLHFHHPLAYLGNQKMEEVLRMVQVMGAARAAR
jgi:hypothetical protein